MGATLPIVGMIVKSWSLVTLLDWQHTWPSTALTTAEINSADTQSCYFTCQGQPVHVVDQVDVDQHGDGDPLPGGDVARGGVGGGSELGLQEPGVLHGLGGDEGGGGGVGWQAASHLHHRHLLPAPLQLLGRHPPLLIKLLPTIVFSLEYISPRISNSNAISILLMIFRQILGFQTKSFHIHRRSQTDGRQVTAGCCCPADGVGRVAGGGGGGRADLEDRTI